MFLFITLLLGQIIIDVAVHEQGDETNFCQNFSHALFYFNYTCIILFQLYNHQNELSLEPVLSKNDINFLYCMILRLKNKYKWVMMQLACLIQLKVWGRDRVRH